jgi:hypothetical protein
MQRAPRDFAISCNPPGRNGGAKVSKAYRRRGRHLLGGLHGLHCKGVTASGVPLEPEPARPTLSNIPSPFPGGGISF